MSDLKNKTNTLIIELKCENNNRSIVMNSGQCSEYVHTALVHEYNHSIEVIKRLENILN